MSRVWHHQEVPGGISIGEDWSYTRRVVMTNPTERRYHRHAYVLRFGAYGWTRLHVYADSLEEALEECADWLSNYAPGHIVRRDSEEYNELMREACSEAGIPWPMPKDSDPEPYWQAEESAMADLTSTEAGYIGPDYGLALEDPDAATLHAYISGD